MKNALIINLSPRQKGTSNVLANMCKEYLSALNHNVNSLNLYENLKDMANIYLCLEKADTVVMSGPSYINTYPADTIALLEGIIEQKHILHGQNLYGIIQGGMPYGHTHESGIRTLELFCKECDMQFKGGFVMGLGPLVNGQSLDKLPNAKSIKRQFHIFLTHIEKGEVSPKTVYQKAQLKIPGFVYKIMANGMNKSIDKDLREHGIDSNQISPYLTT
jgi:hypothetical protein